MNAALGVAVLLLVGLCIAYRLGWIGKPGADRPGPAADNVAVRPDGASVQPDGASVQPDGASVQPDGASVQPGEALVRSDGASERPAVGSHRSAAARTSTDVGTAEDGPPAPAPAARAVKAASASAAARKSRRKPGSVDTLHRQRPRPAGLDFMSAREALKKYLLSLPSAEREVERERLGLISDSKDYLLQLMRYMPFEPEAGKGILLRDGSTIRGSVPYCNKKEIAVRLRGRRKKLKRLSWNELAFAQYVDFFEFYIQTRLDQGGKNGGTRLTEKQKREIGNDCLRLAVLCDWYGDAAGCSRNARRALRFIPEKRSLLRRLLSCPQG